jgi:hypothetical protein
MGFFLTMLFIIFLICTFYLLENERRVKNTEQERIKGIEQRIEDQRKEIDRLERGLATAKPAEPAPMEPKTPKTPTDDKPDDEDR